MNKREAGKAFRFLPLILLIGFVTFFFIQSQFSATGKAIDNAEISKTTSYVYANGLIASADSEGNDRYYVNDHLGGTSIVLDEQGNKISEESYYAFGEERTSSGERFTYTGKEKDDSGLYYYGARYYDSYSGRFLQPDPISGDIENPQSLNRYVYVLNNPYKYVDPSGMDNPPQEAQVYGPPTPPDIAIKNAILEMETAATDNTNAVTYKTRDPIAEWYEDWINPKSDGPAQISAQDPHKYADPFAREVIEKGGNPLLMTAMVAGDLAMDLTDLAIESGNLAQGDGSPIGFSLALASVGLPGNINPHGLSNRIKWLTGMLDAKALNAGISPTKWITIGEISEVVTELESLGIKVERGGSYITIRDVTYGDINIDPGGALGPSAPHIKISGRNPLGTQIGGDVHIYITPDPSFAGHWSNKVSRLKTSSN